MENSNISLQKFQDLAQELKVLYHVSNHLAEFIIRTKFNGNVTQGKLFENYKVQTLAGPFQDIRLQFCNFELKVFGTDIYMQNPIPEKPNPKDDPLYQCVATCQFSDEIYNWKEALDKFLERWNMFRQNVSVYLLQNVSPTIMWNIYEAIDKATIWIRNFEDLVYKKV